MDRKGLNELSWNFKAFIMPLLSTNEPEDYHLVWEFQKYFHSKRVQVMTAESQRAKQR